MQTVRHEIDAAALDAKVKGQTIAGRWLETVAAMPGQVALRSKDGDAWVEVTYGEMAERVA